MTTLSATDAMIATNVSLNRMASELETLTRYRGEMLDEIRNTPDHVSVVGRENAVLFLNRQIDRLTVAYGSLLLSVMDDAR
jgi:hypothetical protein